MEDAMAEEARQQWDAIMGAFPVPFLIMATHPVLTKFLADARRGELQQRQYSDGATHPSEAMFTEDIYDIPCFFPRIAAGPMSELPQFLQPKYDLAKAKLQFEVEGVARIDYVIVRFFSDMCQVQ